MGRGALHVVGNFLDHALLRPRGLERQHGLDLLPHAVVDGEGDAGQRARIAPLERDAAFQPEEFFEDQAELLRRAELVQQAQVGLGRREMRLADGRPAIGEFEPPPDLERQVVLQRVQRFEHAVHDGPQHARGHFGDGFVDGDDAAGVQRGLAIVILPRQDFELRVQHGQLARVAVELDLAEQREPHALGQHVGQIAAMEPFAHQDGARGVREARFEQPQVAAFETRKLRRADLRNYRGHLAGRQLRDGFQVAAVLVAEGHVRQQIFHHREALGFQHGRPRRADAFDVRE